MTKRLCLVKRFYLTHIHQLQVVLHDAYNLGAVTDAEIEIDNRESLGELLHQGE